jgi:hypothetical protein
MYPSHLGPGDRVDFVEPPVDGPILGYSHQAVASLYAYAANNPVNRNDPSGLQPQAGNPKPNPAPPSRPERCYVCKRNTQLGNWIDECGCQHTDIYCERSGKVYQGLSGPTPPDYGGLPKGQGWECIPLRPLRPSYETFFFLNIGPAKWSTFKWGPKKGQSCENAGYGDFVACIQDTPKLNIGKGGIVQNCQTDVQDKAAGCCFGGFVGLGYRPILATL